jgi:hypothetical protein
MDSDSLPDFGSLTALVEFISIQLTNDPCRLLKQNMVRYGAGNPYPAQRVTEVIRQVNIMAVLLVTIVGNLQNYRLQGGMKEDDIKRERRISLSGIE